MDVLHKDTLVLEDVTLRLLVQRVVPSQPSVAPTGTSKDRTHKCLSILPASLYFLNSRLSTRCLLIHSTFVGILASEVPFLLPGPVLPALSLRSEELPGPCTRVHSGRLDDNLAFLDELFNVRARVGVADFALLGGVEPDFAFADACDGGGEPFLGAKVDLQDVKYIDKESLDGRTHVFFPGLLAKNQTTVGFAIKTGYAP